MCSRLGSGQRGERPAGLTAHEMSRRPLITLRSGSKLRACLQDGGRSRRETVAGGAIQARPAEFTKKNATHILT